ncbi:alpha/beta fold hydrolase [Streptomyces sp. VB1]|uniref:alpha/beta fold hydrolase n=1 Tax=Streptomyces sp. VB1 TaxID=2986803 RepID=UPI002241D253|nr:alpha/beta fold hydrolase [Streptomyces sp. VB1]UZI30835.1 FG-GAP-like repeat-containing protein [Streptomyces sp. VB1]
MGDSRLGLVMVHGFMSGPKVWEPLRGLIAADRGLGFVEPLTFEYATGLTPVHPLRVFPSIDTVADSLKEYLVTEAGAYDQLLLVTHSQGGLVAQRYLARMLHDGRGAELARIQRLVLLACPSNGSELLLSLRRRALGGRHPQEKDLRPLNDQVNATLRTVVRDVVHATAITDRTCPIPVSVYAGESDGVVSRASAQSVFPDSSALPGDHSSILKADSPQHRTFTALRRLLLATRTEPYVPGPEAAARARMHTPAGEKPSRKRRPTIAIASVAALAVVASVLYFAPMPWESDAESSDPAPKSPIGAASSGTPSPPRQDGGINLPEDFPATNTFWFFDINKDRKADYVTVYKNQTFKFWWNGGIKDNRLRIGEYHKNSYVPAPHEDGDALRFGDIDGDGWPDCMMVDKTGEVAVHTWVEGNSAGERMCQKEYGGDADVPLRDTADIVPDLKEIQFADVNGDGRVDYLRIEPSSKVTVWYNQTVKGENGPTQVGWSPPEMLSKRLFDREIRYADLDGNGRADPILITPKGGARAWLTREPSCEARHDIGQIVPDPETAIPPEEIQFADVDGDGDADFLHVGKTGEVRVQEPDLQDRCPRR